MSTTSVDIDVDAIAPAAESKQNSNKIEAHRAGAEIFAGDSILCKNKCIELLEGLELPLGLLPLENLSEVGYNRSTDFVWLKQEKKTEHTFQKIGRLVSYGEEVTSFVENRRMKKITGVKSKELLIWITLSDMYVEDPMSGNITFKTPLGLSRNYPVSAFQLASADVDAYNAQKQPVEAVVPSGEDN